MFAAIREQEGYGEKNSAVLFKSWMQHSLKGKIIQYLDFF